MEFENYTYHYLTSHFPYANFVHKGRHNSNEPDIQTKKFNIEVKSPKAQAGQFVVKSQHHQFHLTKRNDDIKLSNPSLTNLEHKILNIMNTRPSLYTNNSFTEISHPNIHHLAYNWIKHYYYSKDNHFFVTNQSKKANQKYYFIPVNHFDKYFHVHAVARRKKSGSAPVGKTFNNYQSIKQNIKDITNLRKVNKHLYIQLNHKLQKSIKFKLDNKYTGFLNAKRDLSHENTYEVKKLSNTNNLTVIFSIQLKHNLDSKMINSDTKAFLRALNK